MIVHWARWLPLWTFLALFAVTSRSEAQLPEAGGPPGYYPGAMGGPGSPSPYGEAPVGYQGPMDGSAGYPMDGYGGYPDVGCEDGSCADGSCGQRGYRGLLGDVLGLVGPYPDGGACAPRWFDLSVEGMWLKRDDTGRNKDITSQGVAGPIVLSTDDLNFGVKPSFRFTGWLQFRAGGNLEFNYYGLFNWSDSQQVNDAGNDLYSAFSQFGVQPLGGFLEDGLASSQRIEYSSAFDNFELNHRRHWQGPGCRYAGSVLWGARHFNLVEDFTFISRSDVNNADMRYNVNVNNAVTGLQTGGDVWITIIPGLRAGVEGKVGVYGNHASQGTDITATTLVDPFLEVRKANSVAFIGDASFSTTFRLTQQFTLKGAYNVLFVEGMALAAENFNAVPPDVFLNGAGRTAQINQNGNALYHGFSGGLEYNW